MVKSKGVEEGEIDRDNKSIVDRGYCSLEHRRKEGGGGGECRGNVCGEGCGVV